MSKVFLILEQLTINKVHYCLQSHGAIEFYNLKVTTPEGEEKYLGSDKLDEIEDQLDAIWGHLINSTATVIKAPAPLSVPIPPPMPPPC